MDATEQQAHPFETLGELAGMFVAFSVPAMTAYLAACDRIAAALHAIATPINAGYERAARRYGQTASVDRIERNAPVAKVLPGHAPGPLPRLTAASRGQLPLPSMQQQLWELLSEQPQTAEQLSRKIYGRTSGEDAIRQGVRRLKARGFSVTHVRNAGYIRGSRHP